MSSTDRKNGSMDEPVEERGPEEGEEKNAKSEQAGEVQVEGEGGVKTQAGGESTSGKTESEKKDYTKLKKGKIIELLAKKNRMLEQQEEQIEKIAEDFKKKEDRLLRLAAEFDNYKKRTRREWELHKKRAGSDLVLDLLPVLDDFERALEASGDTDDRFYKGVEMICQSMVETLQRKGLERIDALGRKFDPQLHEAMAEVESEEVEPGCVSNVIQEGYLFHGQLLRPVKVLVAKEKEDGEEEEGEGAGL